MDNFEELYKKRKEQENKKAAQLVAALTKAGRQSETFKASENAQYRELLYKQFGI